MYQGTGRFRRPLRRVSMLFVSLMLFASDVCQALVVSNAYSPLNAERAHRKSTQFILLHTTEGPGKGSLESLKRYGEAHYMVDRDGHVYRIIYRSRLAYHAGRSMWDGLTNLDLSSIGIEVVGYHNKAITPAQISALRELLAQLQRIYRIPDELVLTHSMVAYGAPNRWHRKSHRGRKRCGMCFARRDLRLQLGLERQPLYDPDVRAGRLVEGDPYLAKVLYGSAREQEQAAQRFEAEDVHLISRTRSAWDIARDRATSSDTSYTFPDGKVLRGDQITDWGAIPVGTRVTLGATQGENSPEVMAEIPKGGCAADIAGDEVHSSTTIYLLKDGRVRQGNELSPAQVAGLPEGTRMLVGYIYGGYITSRRPVYKICGEKWRDPDTVYRLPSGKILRGTDVTESSIPTKAMVFFRR